MYVHSVCVDEKRKLEQENYECLLAHMLLLLLTCSHPDYKAVYVYVIGFEKSEVRDHFDVRYILNVLALPWTIVYHPYICIYMWTHQTLFIFQLSG